MSVRELACRVMRSVSVATDTLLGILQTNRDDHQQKSREAHDIYRAKAIDALGRARSAAETGGKIKLSFHELPEPEDHTKDYDRAIKMLQMHTEATVQLAAEEYDRYVEDDWEWKRRWQQTTASYVGG